MRIRHVDITITKVSCLPTTYDGDRLLSSLQRRRPFDEILARLPSHRRSADCGVLLASAPRPGVACQGERGDDDGTPLHLGTQRLHRDDEAGCSCAGQTDDTSGPRRCGGDVRRFPSQAVN